jgi:outer membrane protein assembly factor BamA
MKKIKLFFTVAVVFVFLPLNLFADKQAGSDEKRWGISPIPILAFSPETGFMFGAAAIYYRYPYPVSPETKPNVVFGQASYTTKKQYIFRLSTDWYFKGDAAKLFADISFVKFPALFYGIGPDTAADLEEDYTPTEFELEGNFLWKIFSQVYVGPRLHLSHLEIKEIEEGGLFDQGDFPGSRGATIFGFGGQLVWDRRDSVFYPLRGSLLEAKTTLYDNFIGSDLDFTQLIFDYRQFINIYKLHVLAFQYYMVLSGGEVPFNVMPRVGGPYLLRGYYSGRFRDENYIAVQGEYRFPIFWRFGGAVFGSIGQVAPEIDEFSFENIKAAAGAGVRFAWDTKQRINVRFDVGFSRSDTSFYVNIGEAF